MQQANAANAAAQSGWRVRPYGAPGLVQGAEAAWRENRDARLAAMARFRAAFPHGHETLRRCPGMESPAYFDAAAARPDGEREVCEARLDAPGVLARDLGRYAAGALSRLGEVRVRGCRYLLEALERSDRAASTYVVTNSVREVMAVGPDGRESYFKDDESERGLTLVAANYYEWFPPAAWNASVFVVVVTNERFYPTYLRLFPHFLFAIQPDHAGVLPYPCVGLTRFTALTAAKALAVRTVFFLDDTVYDLLQPPSGPGRRYDVTGPAENQRIFGRLRALASRPRVGYVGLCTGSFLGDQQWERESRAHGMFANAGAGFARLRTFASLAGGGPVDETLLDSSDFGAVSFANQHRPNFVCVNVGAAAEAGANYVPVHTIGEDIYFTGRLVAAGLTILQANVAFMRPGEDRRPKTCSADGSCALEGWLKEPDTVAALLRNNFDAIMADFFMYNGRYLFSSERGIVGAAGVYGPVRILTADQYRRVQREVSGALEDAGVPEGEPRAKCMGKYMGALKDTGKDLLFFSYANRLTYFGDQRALADETRRPHQVCEYLQCNNLTEEVGVVCENADRCKLDIARLCEGDKATGEHCRIARTLQATYRNFGLAGVEAGGTALRLYQTTGMYKYIKDYEFLQSCTDNHLHALMTGGAPPRHAEHEAFRMDYAAVSPAFRALAAPLFEGACMYDVRSLVAFNMNRNQPRRHAALVALAALVRLLRLKQLVAAGRPFADCAAVVAAMGRVAAAQAALGPGAPDLDDAMARVLEGVGPGGDRGGAAAALDEVLGAFAASAAAALPQALPQAVQANARATQAARPQTAQAHARANADANADADAPPAPEGLQAGGRAKRGAAKSGARAAPRRQRSSPAAPARAHRARRSSASPPPRRR